MELEGLVLDQESSSCPQQGVQSTWSRRGDVPLNQGESGPAQLGGKTIHNCHQLQIQITYFINWQVQIHIAPENVLAQKRPMKRGKAKCRLHRVLPNASNSSVSALGGGDRTEPVLLPGLTNTHLVTFCGTPVCFFIYSICFNLSFLCVLVLVRKF